MDLATRFTQARKQKGISQSELAARIGCAQSLVAKIEAGQAVRSKYMTEFAMELGVSPQWLATGKETKQYQMVAESLVLPEKLIESKATRSAVEMIEHFASEYRRGRVSDSDLEFVATLVERLLKGTRYK